MIDVQVAHSWQLEAEPVRALAFAVHSNPFAALGPQGNAIGRVVHIDGLHREGPELLDEAGGATPGFSV